MNTENHQRFYEILRQLDFNDRYLKLGFNALTFAFAFKLIFVPLIGQRQYIKCNYCSKGGRTRTRENKSRYPNIFFN